VFLADLLDGMPLPNGGSGFGGTLALRASPDPARGGFRVEVIGVGIPVSRARVEGCSKALASLREAAESHGGALEVMPDASGTLIRLRLPVGPTEELQTTISTAG
jgi:signal transduction histidine kinase